MQIMSNPSPIDYNRLQIFIFIFGNKKDWVCSQNESYDQICSDSWAKYKNESRFFYKIKNTMTLFAQAY